MGTSSSEEERALEALLGEAREEPGAQGLERLEARLRPWLAPRPRTSLGSGSQFYAIALVVGVCVFGGATALVFRASEPAKVASSELVEAPARAPVAATAPPAATTEASVSVRDLPFAPVETSPDERTARRAGASRAAATSKKTAESPPAIDVAEPAESEASFLRRTQAALSRDPARALGMTARHAELYPRGFLLQERDVIAIDALVRLGRLDEARARAAEFHARYPQSAHASRIATILGDEAR